MVPAVLHAQQTFSARHMGRVQAGVSASPITLVIIVIYEMRGEQNSAVVYQLFPPLPMYFEMYGSAHMKRNAKECTVDAKSRQRVVSATISAFKVRVSSHHI